MFGERKRIAQRVVCGLVAVTFFLGAGGLARAAAAKTKLVLSKDAVVKLTYVQDDADFLGQVAFMVVQMRNNASLSDDQKRALIQGSMSDIKTASASLALVRQATNKQNADPRLGAIIVQAQTALATAIINVKNAVAIDSLSADSKTAFQQMSLAARNLVLVIDHAFAHLPATQQPVALTLSVPRGQARIVQAGQTVRWVLNGPRTAITSPSGRWALTSGRTNPVEQTLATPFVRDFLGTGKLNTSEGVHSKATDFGGWTYVYFRLGNRRPVLLLLNLGASVGSSSSGSNASSSFGSSGGTLSIGSWAGGTLTIGGSVSIIGYPFNYIPYVSPYSSSTVATDQVLTEGTVTTVSTDFNPAVYYLTWSGNVTGTGSLVKTGPGTLTLSGNNTYTGGTTVSAGALVVDNASALGTGPLLTSAGTIFAGSGTVSGAATLGGNLQLKGNLTFAQGLELQSTATVPFLASGAPHGADSFMITVEGNCTLGGNLSLEYDGAYYTPAGGDSFTLFHVTDGALSGTFANVLLAALPPGLQWDTSQLYVNGTISVAVDPAGFTIGSGSSLGISGNGYYGMVRQGNVMSAGVVPFTNIPLTVEAQAWVFGRGTIPGPGFVDGILMPGHDVTYPGYEPGRFVFGQGLSLGADAVAKLSDNNTIAVNGNLQVGGHLEVYLDPANPTPALGEIWPLFQVTNGTITGAFSSIELPSLAYGQLWDTSLLYTNGSIAIAPDPAIFLPVPVQAGETLTLNGNLMVGDVLTLGTLTVATGGEITGQGDLRGASYVNGLLVPANSLYFHGNLTLGANSSTVLDLAKMRSIYGAEIFPLRVNGNLVLGGNLTVTGNVAFHSGDRYQLWTNAAPSGQFTNVSLPALPEGLTWDTTKLYTNGYITVDGPPEIFSTGIANQDAYGAEFSTASGATVRVGDTVACNVQATGGPDLIYQWQASTDQGATWSNLDSDSAEFDSTIVRSDIWVMVIYRAAPALNGVWFRCQITNGIGPLQTTTPIVLNVVPR